MNLKFHFQQMVMKPKYDFKQKAYVLDGSAEQINLIFFHHHHHHT